MIDMKRFEELDALSRGQEGEDEYGSKALLLASMQKTACVLMHMISRIRAKTVIMFVDTQLHFPETLEIRDEMARR